MMIRKFLLAALVASGGLASPLSHRMFRASKGWTSGAFLLLPGPNRKPV